MARERLTVDFERHRDGGVVLRLRGKLERTTVALLQGVLDALRGDPAPLVIDLTDVDHIDSHGLDVLLALEADGARQTSVEVIGVRESLRARRPRLDR